ncbi:hypothetical protein R3P38DRAFT_2770615 [Favolaschia claudopus]|uniref:Uncharacterized protein n=1 Tax=Favolaschia claudopus TaxID=2862362 RepID=A0AAW0CGZ4_9AGAR
MTGDEALQKEHEEWGCQAEQDVIPIAEHQTLNVYGGRPRVITKNVNPPEPNPRTLKCVPGFGSTLHTWTSPQYRSYRNLQPLEGSVEIAYQRLAVAPEYGQLGHFCSEAINYLKSERPGNKREVNSSSAQKQGMFAGSIITEKGVVPSRTGTNNGWSVSAFGTVRDKSLKQKQVEGMEDKGGKETAEKRKRELEDVLPRLFLPPFLFLAPARCGGIPTTLSLSSGPVRDRFLRIGTGQMSMSKSRSRLAGAETGWDWEVKAKSGGVVSERGRGSLGQGGGRQWPIWRNDEIGELRGAAATAAEGSIKRKVSSRSGAQETGRRTRDVIDQVAKRPGTPAGGFSRRATGPWEMVVVRTKEQGAT